MGSGGPVPNKALTIQGDEKFDILGVKNEVDFWWQIFCQFSLQEKPREARDLISKIRSCTVRSDLKNKQKTAENALFLRSDLTVQDRILEIRSLASLGIGLKFVTENFTTFFTARIEICHLELTLGASSPKQSVSQNGRVHLLGIDKRFRRRHVNRPLFWGMSCCPFSPSSCEKKTEKEANKEGKRAINRDTLGTFCQIRPRVLCLCRPVGGLQQYLC